MRRTKEAQEVVFIKLPPFSRAKIDLGKAVRKTQCGIEYPLQD
jgi:hypothetical protein